LTDFIKYKFYPTQYATLNGQLTEKTIRRWHF
jgi:hypothetical protein